jgi:hypothetical protein
MERLAGGWTEGDRDDLGIEQTGLKRQCHRAADRARPQDGEKVSGPGS